LAAGPRGFAIAVFALALALGAPSAIGSVSTRACESVWQSKPAPRGDVFNAVDAASPTSAWAVGNRVARWSRGSWATVTGRGYRNPGTEPWMSFEDVVVRSPTDVWVLGGDFVMRWNGKRWRALPDLDLSGYDYLSDLAVAGPRDAWVIAATAEDEYGNGPVSHYWAIHWDGSSWSSRQELPLPYAYEDGGLHESDAAAGGDPWVAGYDATHSDVAGHLGKPLLARKGGGKWIAPAVPVRAQQRRCGTAYGGFVDVNAHSSGDVWVAGWAGACAIAARWSGRNWRVMRPTNKAERIATVDAASRNDVWALGDRGGLGAGVTLVLRYDGSRWRTVHSIRPSHMTDLVALPSGAMWAVGPINLHHRCR
jgi:hypothetical protein